MYIACGMCTGSDMAAGEGTVNTQNRVHDVLCAWQASNEKYGIDRFHALHWTSDKLG